MPIFLISFLGPTRGGGGNAGKKRQFFWNGRGEKGHGSLSKIWALIDGKATWEKLGNDIWRICGLLNQENGEKKSILGGGREENSGR